jgi:4-amino-4-deoxy-L-arabinose transferase-like glycosyltransferase
MAGLFAAALAVRIAFAWGFDGLYGQDAYAYYSFANALRAGDVLKPFFWPLGYPALLALAFGIFGAAPLTAQAISLLLGAALAPLTYALARQVGAQMLGAIAAGLILAACGQAIQSSFVVMADVPALFWAVLSALALLRHLRGGAARWLVVSAAALALACVTRWLYLALIPVWSAALLLAWRRVRVRPLLAAGGAAAAILIPQALVSLHSPYPVLDHAWVEGWSPANAFASRFDNVDGHFQYKQINALYYAQPYYDPYFLAPVFTPFILAGAWALRRRHAHAALMLGWALLPCLFLAGIPYQNIRFPLIVVPAVAALAGLGLEATLRRLPVPRVAAALLIAGIAFMLYAAQPTLQTFVANQMRDKRAVAWALARVPPDARLYTFELTQPLQALASFEVRELYDETPASLDAELADGTPAYLFANVWTIEHQWAGRALDTTYQWLRDSVGLRYVARIGNYWLFRIRNETRTAAAWLQRAPG